MLTPVRIRITMTKNRLLGEGRKGRLRLLLLAGLFLFIWVNMFIAMGTEAPAREADAEPARIHPYFLPLFTLLFLGSLTAVSNLLFFGDDIKFLSAFPWSAGAIVRGKLLEAFLLEINFIFLFAVPMVLAAIVSLAIPVKFIPALILCLFSTFILAFGSGSLISLGLARLAPGYRGRMAVSVIASLLGVATWYLIVRLSSAGVTESTGSAMRDGLVPAAGGLAGFFPLYWGADAFSAFRGENPAAAAGLVACQLLLGGLMLGGSAAAGRYILRTRGAMAFSEIPGDSAAGAAGGADFGSPRWTRDIKLALRTPQATTQLLSLTLMVSLLPVLFSQGSGGIFVAGLLPYPTMSLALIAFLLLHSGVILAPLEGAGVWIMKTAPGPPARFFIRKTVIAVIPGFTAFLIAGTLSRGTPLRFVELVSFLLIAPALTSTGVHAGFRWGNFRWENYREILPQAVRFFLLPLAISVGALFAAVVAMVPYTGIAFLPRKASVLLLWLFISLVLVSANNLFSISLLRNREL